jgi:hypothetical protein
MEFGIGNVAANRKCDFGRILGRNAEAQGGEAATEEDRKWRIEDGKTAGAQTFTQAAKTLKDSRTEQRKLLTTDCTDFFVFTRVIWVIRGSCWGDESFYWFVHVSRGRKRCRHSRLRLATTRQGAATVSVQNFRRTQRCWEAALRRTRRNAKDSFTAVYSPKLPRWRAFS